MASINFELGTLARKRELGPVLDNITVPVRMSLLWGVLRKPTAMGKNGYAPASIGIRAHSNIQISAKVASNHGAILKKDFLTIAGTVREVAALDHGRNPR